MAGQIRHMTVCRLEKMPEWLGPPMHGCRSPSGRGESYLFSSRLNVSRDSLARLMPTVRESTEVSDDRLFDDFGKNFFSNSSMERYPCLVVLLLSIPRLLEILGQELDVQLRLKIVLSFDPNKTVALRDHGHVNRPRYCFGFEGHLLFE